MGVSYKELGPENIEGVKDQFNLLIVTATEIEKKELHGRLIPLDGESQIIKISKAKYTYFLGKFGHYQAIHVACDDQGSTSRNGSITTTTDAINIWNPKAVLMVGIAFGVNKKKQKIGDVLVSERIVSYESQRLGAKKENRGKEGPASSLMLNRFKSVTGWEHKIGVRTPAIIPGMILSGEKLVDDLDFRQELQVLEPTAVGGEMEGAGIYAACDDKVNHWILVKGICDFADGNKNNRKSHNQKVAIKSAVDLCYLVFSSPHSFSDIPLEIPVKTSSTLKKKVHDALTSQVERQIQKQVNSGKYIPKTFIETGQQKDHLRYMIDPILFAEKCLDEIKVMDFRKLEAILVKKSKPPFNFDPDKFNSKNYTLTIDNIGEHSHTWLSSLKKMQADIDHMDLSNDGTSFTYKLRDNLRDFESLNSRVALVTEMPGQGKTNFVCDFADNFILKRLIPCVFLLGTEIDVEDIRKSIVSKIFPDNPEVTFAEALEELKPVCEEEKKFFVIIIDGLNENGNPIQLSKNLETFLSEILDYNFIKVILTCRTEYYKTNFSKIEDSSFKDKILQINSLHSHSHRHDDRFSEKLFRIYFDHFKIKFKEVSGKVYGQLVENFLLMRIFCDSYQGQNIGVVDNIYKEELFSRYFDVKTKEINERLNANDDFGIGGKIDIKKFILKIIEHMIDKYEYANIPFDDLIDNDRHRELYVRFLDENLLVRRDLKDSASLFAQSETVNFTFDEFRDFLISRYLIEKIYKESTDKFDEFLSTQMGANSPIREGCGTFLFHASRKNGDKKLLEIIEKQDWYDDIFQKSIFNLKDEHVEEKDKIKIFKSLEVYTYGLPKVVRAFISRADLDQYKKLNIHHLFEYLRTLSYDNYNTAFVSAFTQNKYQGGQINQDDILSRLQENINENKFSGRSHQIFEMLIYMFTNPGAWEIKALYEKYYHKNQALAKEHLKTALKSKNLTLVHEIKTFCSRYDITL